MITRKLGLISAALAAVTLSAVTTAQTAFDDAEKAVEYRQKAFSIMRQNFAYLGDMVKGDVAWDQQLFAERAADFAKLATIPWPAFNTQGAQPGAGSDALPEIWDNWDDFQARATQFQSDAAALAEAAAGGDMGASKSAFMAAAKNCKACHDQYKD